MRSRFCGTLPITLAVVLFVGAVVASPTGTTGQTPLTATSAPLGLVPPPPSSVPSPAPDGPVEVAPAFIAVGGVTSAGPVAPDRTLDVAVALPSSDPSGLAAFVATTSVPGTPSYRSFLSAGAAEARFGASASAVARAQSYFRGFGLEATANPDGLLLLVSGPAGGLARAFNTSFNEYRTISGRSFVSHPTPATLPASLGTDGVFGLGNVTPLAPAAVVGPAAGPTPDAGCAELSGGLAPCEIADAYDIAPLEANGTNGSGERIGVVDPYASNEGQVRLASDLNLFATEASIKVGTVNYLYPVPTSVNLNASGTNDEWSLEDALDLEWARASAPGATVDMTFAPNPDAALYDAVDWLVSEDAVNVVSMSWGEPDTGVFNAFDQPCTSACNASTDGSYAILGPVLELGAAEGISFFAASGDCGAADGTSGDATNFPASNPYVTGVGGTNLVLNSSHNWEAETAWSGNSTGATSPGCVNQGGSGGGYAPVPEPWWQFGISDPARARGVPDVAMDASTPVTVVIGGADEPVEGTSVGTPIWAGLGAIADQYAGKDLGLLDPALYTILRGPSYLTDFHDITAGSNGYSAGVGWDPVTGIGSPIASALVPALVRGGGLAGAHLSTSVFASPREGPAPLAVSLALTDSGGRGLYTLQGIYFGDGESTLANSSIVVHTYTSPGDYLAQSFVADESGNSSVSLPVLIQVGGGTLSVNLSVAPADPAVGGSVMLNATASGGTVAPYYYSFYFGDGGFTTPTVASSVDHAYQVAGAFCAEVFVTDSADPSAAGASPRVAVTVGGGAALDCADSLIPFAVTVNGTPSVRDAPADYGTSLFTTSGGANAPDGLTPTVELVSNDPYIPACACEIFRQAGDYSITESAEDTADESANATTNVTIAPALDATFGASTLSGPAPLTVHFYDSAQGGYRTNVTWTGWTFGNGATATGPSVNATYRTAGEYLAVGQLSDRGEGNASEAFLLDVQPAISNPPLGVTGTITPAVDLASGDSVRFSASAVGPGGLTTSAPLAWNLGAGHSGFGSSLRETYDGPLARTANNTLSGDVTVDGPDLEPIVSASFVLPDFFALGPGGAVPRADALVATAAVTPSQASVPFTVYGNATASGPASMSISWLYGDGTMGSGPAVHHTFTVAAGYTVLMTANNSWGDTASLLSAVAANGPLGISGSPSRLEGAAPFTVTINVTAYGGAGPPYQYGWTFVNGSHSNATSVTLVFPNLGTYEVRLNATDRLGGMVEQTFTIVVDSPWPFAALEIAVGGAIGGALIAVGVLRIRRMRERERAEDAGSDASPGPADGPPAR